MRVALGIDVGSTTVKVAVVRAEDAPRVIARHDARYLTQRPAPGQVTQEPAAWIAALLEALSACADEIDEVVGVGVCGQGATFVRVDDRGRPIGSAVSWQDQRAVGSLRSLEERFGTAIAQANGNRIGDAPEPKLVWLRDRDTTTDPSWTAITAAAYVGAWLGGANVINEGDAGSWLSWNRHTRSWETSIVEGLGLQPHMPSVVPLGRIIGELSSDAARQTKLPVGVPVAATTTDVAAAAIAAGVGRPGDVYYSKGTGGFVCAHVGPLVDPGELLALPSGLGDTVQLCGATDTLGAAWDWACELTGGVSHAEGEALALAAGPGSGGVITLPWLQGAQHPVLQPNARGVILGLSLETGRGSLLRSVIEGTSAILRTQLVLARDRSGEAFDLIVSSGGPTENDLWNRLDASAANTPLIVAEGTDAAVGAALIAGLAVGLWADVLAAGRAIRGTGRRYEPEPELIQAADRQEPLAQELAARVLPLFDEEL